MHEVVRLSFHNWYIFEASDIDVRGAIGVLGPPGSGKSSIIDGVQVVCLGDNGNFIELNASAGEQRARGAGVLAGNQIDGSENGARPIGQIGQIADGCRHDVEMSGLGRERRIGRGVRHAGIKKSGRSRIFENRSVTNGISVPCPVNCSCRGSGFPRRRAGSTAACPGGRRNSPRRADRRRPAEGRGGAW